MSKASEKYAKTTINKSSINNLIDEYIWAGSRGSDG